MFFVYKSTIFQVTLWSVAFVQARECIKSFIGFNSYENSFLFISWPCCYFLGTRVACKKMENIHKFLQTSLKNILYSNTYTNL